MGMARLVFNISKLMRKGGGTAW